MLNTYKFYLLFSFSSISFLYYIITYIINKRINKLYIIGDDILKEVFFKNSYIGRTFIKPDQNSRKMAFKLKLNVLKEVVKDKIIVLIDDSIVRGTTSSEIISILREAGAKEIHMRISSPPFLWPCFFGIDVPKREELIAYKYKKGEICKLLGADSLEYLSINRLKGLVNNLNICTSCFTGKYPFKSINKNNN